MIKMTMATMMTVKKTAWWRKLSVYVCVLTLSLAGEGEGQVSYVVLGPFSEQQRAGVMVGNVASASNIASDVTPSDFQTLRYEFLDPSDLQTASLFTLNGQTGGLFTSAMIDREAVCPFQEECLIHFDVTVSSDVTPFLRILDVAVNVTDVNDNVPAFPREEITLNVPEGNNPGVTYPLPNAVDRDTKQNSVVAYSLLTSTSAFDLDVQENLDTSFKLSLYVNTVLDREHRDRYLVKLTARDGGLQPLTGTLTVRINVTDVNDNAPRFAKQAYSYSVGENTPVGTVIGRMAASDLDSGHNARITYSFSATGPSSRLQELFAIHAETGEIQTVAPLQYVSGNSFQAVVKARDSGTPRQEGQAQLEVVIVDTGNNPPRLAFVPKNPLYERTVLLAENAKVPSLVGTLKAEDNDPGPAGTVHCQTSHPAFRVKKLDQEGRFLVLLQQHLDREQEEKLNITISCSDAGAPSMTSETAFSVVVGDANDNAPVFTQHVYLANLTENVRSHVEVARVAAHDYDSGINARFFFYLHPKGNQLFSLDSGTGVLTSNMVFDREVNSQVSVIVKAIDEGDPAMTATATVVVHILDDNDNAPTLETTELQVAEGTPPDSVVARLSAHDRDVGVNAEVVYYLQASSPPPPFTVLQDGQIRTSRHAATDRELQDLYLLEIVLSDRGSPPLTSSATVTIHIMDVNDNSPVVLFPNAKNNTVTIPWDQTPEQPFAHILAMDADQGDNARLSFFIAGGDSSDLFRVSDAGDVLLQRHIAERDTTFHRLKMIVMDNGRPKRQETRALLNIRIDLTNASFSRHEGPADLERNILIAGETGEIHTIAPLQGMADTSFQATVLARDGGSPQH